MEARCEAIITLPRHFELFVVFRQCAACGLCDLRTVCGATWEGSAVIARSPRICASRCS
ncbi:uncharacterized protein B0I36DRAFT_320712 [Microdochium trichocladiopsis]|uniref:Uncharacterized protein n=1 Tax=Microdochium trichocladiopsis TaxID=1682393 RepID=A0A9P9BRQ9_9PEZI|nr:uncharacterized protein B0I36DRAFT_320712 [Microdochium trichocladiopsis]KAH7033070.1 hypothetical protein B0I36DRAFT_320712 [Microdochium trichocladiopsis]